MRKKNKLVCGVGVNDYEGSIKVNGENIKSYKVWLNMLNRCYSTKCQIKNPTYIECIVCDEWKSFSNFKQWYDDNYKEGLCIDKDILIKGNKVYSPETCRFVPYYINNLLIDRSNLRGELPLGIISLKRKTYTYTARCRDGHDKNLNKTFKTLEEASTWYAETKKRIVKEQAQRAFIDNAIKTDVYLALVRREF